MAIPVHGPSATLGGVAATSYTFQTGDLLLKETGDAAPPGWTVITDVPHLCWMRATQAGACPATELAYPPFRYIPPESTAAPNGETPL
jgi:hypothetical protein